MIFFYKIRNNTFRTYDTQTKEFETIDRPPYNATNHIYYVFDEYGSDEGILQFITDFTKWVHELKEGLGINYFTFKNHPGAIPLIVKKFCPHLDEFEDIDMLENSWIQKCNESSIQVLRKKGISGCFGYDFKAFYLSIMG